MSVLGALTASNNLLHVPVLSVAAQTAPASSSNKTVSNNISVLSESVSLGSSLNVEGVVKTPKGPLADVPVSLHMGDIIVARTQTDASGKYAFSAPVGLNYVAAVVSGSVTVYTVAEPIDTTYPAAPSAVTNVPVNAVPAYGIIAVVTVAIVLGLYLYMRRLQAKSPFAAPAEKPPKRSVVAAERTAEPSPQQGHEPVDAPPTKPSLAAEIIEAPSPPTPEPESEIPPEPTGDAAVVKEASELFKRGDDRQAIGVLYDAAFASLATRTTVTLTPEMTHWERYGAIEAAIPEVREPLRTLTVAFERTSYGGKSLTGEQQNAAIAAFQSISALEKPVEENT